MSYSLGWFYQRAEVRGERRTVVGNKRKVWRIIGVSECPEHGGP
jgi:hypothetical protein